MPPSTKRRVGNTKSLIRTARQKKVKIKSPYFLSVARNSLLTNKAEADGALIPPPPSPSVLRFTQPKEGFEVTPGISRIERRALTNRANPSSFNQIKTESTGKLSSFNFHWTKTLYQNNLKNIAFCFYIYQGLKMQLVICNNAKENFSWESEKMNVKFHNNCEK